MRRILPFAMLRALPLVAAFSLAPSLSQADPLPALNLTLGETTVSGLSSGAFMAVQLQVAFSGAISGAGIVAGGPYGCADGNVYRAIRVCMNAFLGEADAGDAIEDILALSAEGAIDSPANLTGHRPYLFHGMSDDTVDRASMDALSETYELLGVPGEQIIYETNIDAGHGFVTERGDLSCSTTDPDFLIDCNFDQAGDILNQLYPGLSDASEPREASFVTFDQSLYLDGAQGMDETGFVYIPESCAGGAPCKLHIALHGCKQGREVIGEDYARLTGYNRWAEANDIVVLYPQAQRIPSSWWNWFSGNPNGCWDWWGYSSDDYLSQNAPQIAAIARMAAAFGARLNP